jgi:hypothetical protein
MRFSVADIKSVQRDSGDKNASLTASWKQEQQRIAKEIEERRKAEPPSHEAPGRWRIPTSPARKEADLQAAISALAKTRSAVASDLLKTGSWLHQSTEHFSVFFQDSATGSAVANKVEYYLEKLRYDLNMPREVNWPRPCEVFVVKDSDTWDAMVRARVRLESAIGFSSIQDREIFVKGANDAVAVGTFAHELTHIVFAEFAHARPAPLWLHEGLAVYESGAVVGQTRMLRDAAAARKLLPLGDLVESYRERYPTEKEKVILFYLQSSSFVDFLISRFGREKFGEFAAHIAKTGDFGHAVRTVFSREFLSAPALYKAWTESLLQ